jgi:hypothetical protein
MRWARSLGARLAAEGWLKARLGIALTAFFCGPYFALQHVSLFEPRRLPLSAIDRAIGFAPGWIWGYQSVYLLIVLVPWLSTRRDDLRRHARGFVLLAAAGFACFLLYPVDGPRPAHVPRTGMWALLLAYDAPRNAMPSLHVGLAAYTVLFGLRAFRPELAARVRAAWAAAGLAWLAVIAYATLATKQHYAVDLPPGVAGAWLAHAWVWRDVR